MPKSFYDLSQGKTQAFASTPRSSGSVALVQIIKPGPDGGYSLFSSLEEIAPEAAGYTDNINEASPNYYFSAGGNWEDPAQGYIGKIGVIAVSTKELSNDDVIRIVDVLSKALKHNYYLCFTNAVPASSKPTLAEPKIAKYFENNLFKLMSGNNSVELLLPACYLYVRATDTSFSNSVISERVRIFAPAPP